MEFTPKYNDPLGEALHLLRMSGVFYSRSDLSEPWAMAIPPTPGVLTFHVVLGGCCNVEFEGRDRVKLRSGELALVPHGLGHLLSGEDRAEPVGLDQLDCRRISPTYALFRHGGGGAPTTLVCGVMRFDHPAARQLIGLFPPVIHIEDSHAPEQEWLHSALRWMAAEALEVRPGGEAVITRLADIVVIQAIRSWLARDPAARTGWLGALQDPQIGRALAGIHTDPARPWTVTLLAREAGMSRSSFAARFTELVGEPAMRYVTRWRMTLAHGWLEEGPASVAEIGARLGYHSEAAFSRVFKRTMGVSPGAVRRQKAGA